MQIEGDPDSPVSRGRLCPKGSATLQLTTGDARRHQVLYRRPFARAWEPLDLETAMDMVADRVVRTRRETWQDEHEGKRVNRTLGIAGLGGATLDNDDVAPGPQRHVQVGQCAGAGEPRVDVDDRGAARLGPSSARSSTTG